MSPSSRSAMSYPVMPLPLGCRMTIYLRVVIHHTHSSYAEFSLCYIDHIFSNQSGTAHSANHSPRSALPIINPGDAVEIPFSRSPCAGTARTIRNPKRECPAFPIAARPIPCRANGLRRSRDQSVSPDRVSGSIRAASSSQKTADSEVSNPSRIVNV